MFYLIGGAPRAGKTTLAQNLAVKLKAGWISTDLLYQVLRAKDVSDIKSSWDASEKAIIKNARWFFPCLESFMFGANSMADNFVIEGVDFLPKQVVYLAKQYKIRSVFLGCSRMSWDRFQQFPGKSRGYSLLPEEMQQQIIKDVPKWSKFVAVEASKLKLPYFDMANNFPKKLAVVERVLLEE